MVKVPKFLPVFPSIMDIPIVAALNVALASCGLLVRVVLHEIGTCLMGAG